MLKRAVRVVTVLGALLAGYAGYVRLFGAVEALLRPHWNFLVITESDRVTESQTAREATRLAITSFGADHWSVKAPIRYYNSERGFWMFAGSYKREKEGKRITFEPFAVVWRSRDSNALKTVLAQKAVADFDQPFDGAIKPGSKPSHVVHAVISGDVQLRDDKGSPADLSDDLIITQVTYVEFDEQQLQLRSDSPVHIRDADTIATAVGFQIDLRPQATAGRSGFNGAKTAWLLKNVHIVIPNVGRSGILPGTNPGQAQAQGPTPLDVKCDWRMRVDLPDPVAPPAPGQAPPAKAPTNVWFYRNVRVRRGIERPDQLNCDELFLTFLPAPKDPPQPLPPGVQQPIAAIPAPANTSQADEPLGGLVLRRAEATGHAVWLQSEAQDLKVRGNQLIHEKNAPSGPDKTYFRADSGVMLLVEKTERVPSGPDQGKIKSIDTLRAVDATIFDNGQPGSPLTTVARGPGRMETRARRDGPIERWGEWRDELIAQVEGQGESSRRIIILTGRPKLVDPLSGTIEARSKIVAWLRPKPAAGAAASSAAPSAATAASSAAPSAATAQAGAADTLQIESMTALDDVRLYQEPSPQRPDLAKRTLRAAERLDVVFQAPPPEAAPAAGPPAAQTAATPAPSAEKPAEPARPGQAQTADAGTPPAERKPPAPALEINAQQLWARVLQHPGQQNQTEVLEARLRGGFAFHQDPAPGKAKGTDLTGDKADILGQGQGLYLFRTHGTTETAARLVTDEFEIEGPIMALDQSADFAWVIGAGKLTQMVEKGMLNDGGLVQTGGNAPSTAAGRNRTERPEPAAGAAAPAGRPGEKVPLVITWQSKMTFHGRTPGKQSKEPGAAKAEFFTDVTARTEDADMACDRMEAFFDRTVSFARAGPMPGREGQAQPQGQEEPRPQIALVQLHAPRPKRVVLVNVKREAETRKLLEKQRIEGNEAWYNKVTGQFGVDGEGWVRLYNLEGPGPAQPPRGTRLLPTSGTVPARVSNTSAPPRAAVAANPARGSGAAAKGRTQAAAKTTPRKEQNRRPAAPSLKLTRIHFTDRMRGRFGSGNDTETAAPRQADFFRDVEVLNGPVASAEADLDPDRPPPEYVFLTSQFLRVTSEPPPPRSSEAARNFLNALYNANASTREATGAESAIQGDQITYDSFKDLFYIYAFEGREVLISQQTGPGQPRSDSSGSSVMYNHRTGEAQQNAPRGLRMIDQLKTGTRAPEVTPPKPTEPKKPPRHDPRLPSRGDKERRGFTGR